MKWLFCVLITMLFATIVFAQTAPSAPTGLSATAISCNQITLSWNASSSAISYDIYSCSGSAVTTTSSTNYTISSLDPITAYNYKVRANNTYGSSSFTACHGTTTQMCDTAFHWSVNNYPWTLVGSTCDTLTDPYDFYMFQCTSYVGWKINNLLGDTSTAFTGHASYPFNNYMNGGTVSVGTTYCTSTDPMYRISNACHWAVALQAMGYMVDENPTVGAIAQWNQYENGVGNIGHVAFVDSVSGDDVYISNYNGFNNAGASVPCGYGYFHINMTQPYNSVTNILPGRFIHIDQARYGTLGVPTSNVDHDQFNFSPNPTNGKINVSIHENNISCGTLTVYNLLGIKIIAQPLTNKQSYEFDLTNEPDGLYLMQLITTDGSISKKFEMVK